MRIALFIATLFIGHIAHAATRYVAKTGTDAANDCTTEGSPCATIARGIEAMLGGDTLIVGDGVYAEQIVNMKDGTAGAYTTIKAAHDWAVTIDGSGFANDYTDGIRVDYASYVVVRGFHVKMNQANDNNTGVHVYSADHVKIQRCSVSYSGTIGNVAAFDVGPAADYVLLEESYAYGGARYPFLVYQSTHTVVRRNVSRLDYWNGSLQAANFTNYNGDDTVWQNNIAIDSDTANIGGSGQYAGFFNENKVPDASWPGTATRETYRGNIVLNVRAFYSGMYDYDISNLHTYTDNIIWDSHGGYYGEYIHGDAAVLDAKRFTIGHILGSYDSANGQGSGGTGVYVGNNVSNTLSDSILWFNPSHGVTDYVVSDYNSLWNNSAGNYGGSQATPTAGAHDLNADLTAGLVYLPRVEGGSVLATAAAAGGAIGANVEYMWGATGTLWGEPGYDTITTERLWPFPNEDVIKADMASYSGPGGAGVRGFTAGTSVDGSPQTLTKYVWEYLGNEIPGDIYGFHIVTGALPAGTIGAPYQVQLAAAAGTEPYTWSLTGSLPAGLSFSAATATISGTPTAAGTSTITVSVTDSDAAPKIASVALQLVIAEAAITPTPSGGVGPTPSGPAAATPSTPTTPNSKGCGCREQDGSDDWSERATLAVAVGFLIVLRRRRRF